MISEVFSNLNDSMRGLGAVNSVFMASASTSLPGQLGSAPAVPRPASSPVPSPAKLRHAAFPRVSPKDLTFSKKQKSRGLKKKINKKDCFGLHLTDQTCRLQIPLHATS